jgi:NADH-quinone oxidoreductase subunit A
MAGQFLPVLITLAAAVLFAIGLLAVAALFAQRARKHTPLTRTTYESGVPLVERSDKRFSVKFYLVALVFVVLDVEVAFLYPWAVAYRDLLGEGSMVPLWDMLAFIALLAFAYAYLWKTGVFDWGARRPVPPLGSDGGER